MSNIRELIKADAVSPGDIIEFKVDGMYYTGTILMYYKDNYDEALVVCERQVWGKSFDRIIDNEAKLRSFTSGKGIVSGYDVLRKLYPDATSVVRNLLWTHRIDDDEATVLYGNVPEWSIV